ncbi:MAG: hypothetical protein HQK65_01825 [Desulfamplus sp.]|nr:hypothetical protein [Desulfamplus sp.]
MNISKFNLQKFRESNRRTLIFPSGDYLAVLETSKSIKSNRNQDVLRLTWVMLTGEYPGEAFYSYFNMNNPDALNIFYKMVQNMGFIPEKVKDTEELHRGKCRLLVERYDHPVYGPSNIVDKYLPIIRELRSKRVSENMLIAS